jgi:death-on-curing protein
LSPDLPQSALARERYADPLDRFGWLATAVFYGSNDVALDAPDDDADDLVIAVASGHLELTEVAIALAGWRG